MQDGKALQAGTSHYLGTNFAEAAGIKYQSREGSEQFCHTTSWGVSTRMIGGVIMTHGDDDGLRVPPAIAPHQVVILPMLRGKDGDEAVIAYCEKLRAQIAGQSALGEKVRVLLDTSHGKATAKRWNWVRKGAPIIIEVGSRDMDNGVVSMLRRDQLWNEEGRANFTTPSIDECADSVGAMLEQIQHDLFEQARERRDNNITRGIATMDEVAEFYGSDRRHPGWLEVQWSKPSGDELEGVVEQLKNYKLTIRNVPTNADPADGDCIFTGKPAVERVLIARAY